MNVAVVLQCRSQSKRLPRKIYADLGNGKYSIQCILEGLKKTIVPNKIILAMPDDDRVEIEDRIAKGELDNFIDDRFELFIADGDQNDVLNRYYLAMRKYGIDVCARITGDCPMHIGANKLMDEMLLEYLKLGLNGFYGNNLLVSELPFPCGVDIEIFDYKMLCWTKMNAKTDYEKEHVVPLMYSDLSPFSIRGHLNKRPNKMITNKIADFSLDTPEDLELIKKIMANYDKYGDLNKAIESTDISGFDKTNYSKNFRQ